MKDNPGKMILYIFTVLIIALIIFCFTNFLNRGAFMFEAMEKYIEMKIEKEIKE